MPLTSHVSSLALSMQLKALGVKQESQFYWRLSYHTSERFEKGVSQGKEGIFGDYRIEYLPKPRYTTADCKWNERDLAKLDETEVSAFLASELGEIICKDYTIVIFRIKSGWRVYLHDENGESFIADTLPDALTKVLLYLLQNNLITLP